MQIDDDRTDAQRQTHTVLIAGTDRFLSGWGKAQGGTSYAAWACRDDDAREVMGWVERRGDMKRVRMVGNDWRPKGRGHAHIYVVDTGHPSIARRDEFRAQMAAVV